MSLLTNLKAYWKLDNSLNDEVNGNTLTNVNSASFVGGKINNGIDLERGSAQYLTAADSVSLSITGDMTLSGWFNFESNTDSYHLIAKRTSTGNQRSFSLTFNGVADTLTFAIFSDGSTDSVASVSWNPSTSTWYHVVVVYSAAAGSAAFYVNGSQLGTTQTGLFTAIFDSTSVFQIGEILVADGAYFDGIVDEIGVWARTLTSDEIGELYSSGNGNQYPFTNNADFLAFLI